MTNYFILAAGDDDPQQWTENPNPLLPAGYDLVWSLICFIIIFVLFWKFVLPTFKRVLAEREEQIEGGIQRAEAAQGGQLLGEDLAASTKKSGTIDSFLAGLDSVGSGK